MVLSKTVSAPASTVHDDPIQATPDANTELATPSGDGAQLFDPEEFEQAAAQLRPTWEEIPEPEAPDAAILPAELARMGGSPPPERMGVSPGTGEVDVSIQPPLVVPRPPRTPQLDMRNLGSDEEDELGARLRASISPKPKIGLWIGVAAVVFLATLGFALSRSGGSKVPVAEPAKSATHAVAPEAAAEASPVPSPATPSAPVAVTPPSVEVPTAAPSAPPAPKPMEEARAPKPEAVSTRHESRAEKHTRSSSKPSASERRPSSRSSASKPKRGAGFVSTNPY